MRTLPEDRVPLVCECDTRNPVDGPCEKCSTEIDQPEVLECRECKGTGMRDSGGVTPWDAPILVPCDHGAP